MKKKFQYISFLCLVVFSNSAFSFETHCDDEAQIVFNCKIRNSTKIVSVCNQRMSENKDETYLQYRYGAPGKIELIFPNQHHIKRGQFSYYPQYSRNAGFRAYELTFNIGGNKYQVSWMESSKEDGEPKEKVDISSGIHVLASSGKSIYLECGENVVQRLESTYGYNVEETDGIDH